MTKEEAIAEINAIQEGRGVNRTNYPDTWIGSIPLHKWDDELFTLGWEYGRIHMLKEIFNISEGEL